MENFIKIGLKDQNLAVHIDYTDLESIKTLLYAIFQNGLDDSIMNMIREIIISQERPEVDFNEIDYILSLVQSMNADIEEEMLEPIVRPTAFS
jgi:hypothetical protein